MQICDIFVTVFVVVAQAPVLRVEAATTTMTTEKKASLENNHLRNGDYYIIFTSSSHLLLLTEVKLPINRKDAFSLTCLPVPSNKDIRSGLT